jgi:hypothetical protein
MQNLFERLKPEAKAIINEQANLYPFSIAKLTEELKSNYCLGDIKYDYIVRLARDSKLRKIAGIDGCNYINDLLITNLYKLFNN